MTNHNSNNNNYRGTRASAPVILSSAAIIQLSSELLLSEPQAARASKSKSCTRKKRGKITICVWLCARVATGRCVRV